MLPNIQEKKENYQVYKSDYNRSNKLKLSNIKDIQKS